AAALSERAGEDLARAHHGSRARERRVEMEDALKAGRLPCMVATSSLELGIDMGAIDLVIQVETPPSVASGIQRIGRAGHQAGAVSRGIVFPKYRGDLLATAALTPAMPDGAVEATRIAQEPRAPRACRAGRARPPVRAPAARAAGGRARHAVGPLSLGRVRRAASPPHLGPAARPPPPARGRAR